MRISELLEFTRKNKASDLHLASGRPPTLRVNGEIVPLRVDFLSSDEVMAMLDEVMPESEKEIYKKNLEVDFAINHSSKSRFRVNAFHTASGHSAVFRFVPSEILSISELGLPATLKGLSSLSKGLILVTGPTGSGKSTTMSAMVEHINRTQQKHILTIEDPIEFIHKSKKSLINQREVGSHTKSFSNALRSSLREDPDVILVGEMRDLETIRLALTAAETGHLVIATLHTMSAAKTIDRIIDVFSEGDKDMARTMLSSSLEAIVTQLLLKTSDNKSRVPALEILIANSAIRNLIRDNKVPQILSIMQVNAKYGMRVMKDSIYEHFNKKTISEEEVRRALNFAYDDDAKEYVESEEY